MKLRFGLLTLVALASIIPLASAFSTIMNIDGNVYNTDGTPLVGVHVQVWINGTERWTISNVTTYNYSSGYESYFLFDVQGDTEEQGLPVSFTIQGIPTVQSAVFTPQTSIHLNLTPQSYIPPESIPSVTSSSTTSSTLPQTTTSTTSVAQTTTLAASSTSVPSTTIAASTTTQPASSTTAAASSTTLPVSASQPETTTSSTVLVTSSTLAETAQPASTTISRPSYTTLRTRENPASGASLGTYLPYLIIGGIVILILFVSAVIIFLLLKQ